MKITGGQIIFNKLVKNNVKNVFMYSGGAIMGLIDCFYNQNKYDQYSKKVKNVIKNLS